MATGEDDQERELTRGLIRLAGGRKAANVPAGIIAVRVVDAID